ncbi:MAG: hypothetical protein IT373_23085 [Polyangiaceae bacterium]|nr:hypothetical protein [Polyangiaceae bacterium]
MARTRLSRARMAAVALGALALVLAPRSAPASVSEQRARLPPPAFCEDPVVGVWRAHVFHERHGFWGIYVLDIHRKSGSPNELVGTMTGEEWPGGAGDAEPGTCQGAVRWRFHVTMNATGRYDAGEVRFDGLDWKIDRVLCGTLPEGFRYNPDHYSGRIDPAIQEFQSVNNDGGIAVNEPIVFRRVTCRDESGPKLAPHVEPPPFLPPAREGC